MGKISIKEAVYVNSNEKELYDLIELKNLYFKSRSEYENVKDNLVCPNCKMGKVYPRKLANSKFIYATFHNTHDEDCDYYLELQTRKESEVAYTENHKGVLKRLDALFGKLLAPQNIKSDFVANKKTKRNIGSQNKMETDYMRVDRLVIGQKNLKFELNDDDYNCYKIFYGIVKLESIQETDYFYNIEFKGVGEKSSIVRLGIYKGIYSKINVDLNRLQQSESNVAISVVGIIERNEIYKKNQLQIKLREDIQIQGVDNEKV